MQVRKEFEFIKISEFKEIIHFGECGFWYFNFTYTIWTYFFKRARIIAVSRARSVT